MADLQRSLHALVDNPPFAPPPIATVAARGGALAQRRRTGRAIGALALAFVASAAAINVLSSDGENGLDVASDGLSSAGYVAENPGGYVATGAWTLTITRGDQVIELSSTTSDYCGPVGVILPGDEVRGSITGAASTLRVGETASCPD